MTNYPGISILSEIGSRKELAESYGVSERTIYRWLNKAQNESGFKPKKPRRPRLSTLENFAGTRAELAKRYGVSERTVYRWINKARTQGASIPSRSQASRYPGTMILSDNGTRGQLAQAYGVSKSTIDRWKKRAKIELSQQLPEEIFTPDQLPEEIFTPDQLPEEIITPDMLPEEIITPEDIEEEYDPNAFPEEIITEEPDDIHTLIDMILDSDSLVENSVFHTFDVAKQADLLRAYIEYQSDQNPGQFYNSEIHDFDYSPEFISTINIWGDEFENWLDRMENLKAFGDIWLD